MLADGSAHHCLRHSRVTCVDVLDHAILLLSLAAYMGNQQCQKVYITVAVTRVCELQHECHSRRRECLYHRDGQHIAHHQHLMDRVTDVSSAQADTPCYTFSRALIAHDADSRFFSRHGYYSLTKQTRPRTHIMADQETRRALGRVQKNSQHRDSRTATFCKCSESPLCNREYDPSLRQPPVAGIAELML